MTEQPILPGMMRSRNRRATMRCYKHGKEPRLWIGDHLPCPWCKIETLTSDLEAELGMRDPDDRRDREAGLKEGEKRAATGAAAAGMTAEQRYPGWNDWAFNIIREIALNNELVYVDDVHDEAERQGLPKPPNRGSAWGWPWRRAIVNNIIENTGNTRKTTRAVAHAMPRPIYRSLIFQG